MTDHPINVSELGTLINKLAGKPINDTSRLFPLIACAELAFPVINSPLRMQTSGTHVVGPGDNLQIGGVGNGPDGRPVFVCFTDGAYLQATNPDKHYAGVSAKTVLDWCLRDGKGLIVNSPLGGWIYVTAEGIPAVLALCK